MEIKKEYLLLFNTISDVERELHELQLQLIAAQQEAEELYVSDET